MNAKHITSNELRELYQKFFESKGHTRIPSAPLVPENDPSVLFTTAGMHPLVPYLKGQPHPAGKRLTDVQKCLRTTDIEEVGDTTHATVFEMLGNWSLGDYFKKDAITWSYEFLTGKEWLGLDVKRLAVSVFAGDDDSPRDEESASVWKSLGISEDRIAYLGKEDNWWPAGGKQPGPQGPDTEMFYWVGEDEAPQVFEPSNKKWVEIWNDVFMQFDRKADGSYEELPQQNVDTGMGLERTVMVLNGLTSIYDIDSFTLLMKHVDAYTKTSNERARRMLADHIKAATFVLGDNQPVVPDTKDQGYVLRRLIRRAVLALRELGVTENASEVLSAGAAIIISEYGAAYPSLQQHATHISEQLKKEIDKFDTALDRALREFDRIARSKSSGNTIASVDVFRLYEAYGLPVEITQELAQKAGLTLDLTGFKEALSAHQAKSRTAAAGKFKGGLADHSEKSVHYHTATHLLHQALRTVLGDHVLQRGSNITPERLRFDFSHPNKMTPDQIKAVEDLVNQKIQEKMLVTREEMTVEEAKKRGALGLFEHKYGDKVSVYTMGDFSCEICGGPHVANTGELGMFRIKKEESASAGIRRIKAILG
ncbi:MAG: alanine--tRNA ligase [Candidatus Andersenbacteria bacterium]|nr:alanine--tRNA ligase [Candidatus Andersenbacteria bacterium]MBI3250314.1 alanine--tRNA ligase [Candidatus Andersenbacteria bacterium]